MLASVLSCLDRLKACFHKKNQNCLPSKDRETTLTYLSSQPHYSLMPDWRVDYYAIPTYNSITHTSSTPVGSFKVTLMLFMMVVKRIGVNGGHLVTAYDHNKNIYRFSLKKMCIGSTCRGRYDYARSLTDK